jgi:hypothetical protein
MNNMKKEMFISLFAAVMMMSASVAVGQTTVKETRSVSGFTEIGFGIAGNLSVKIGPEFSVVLEGDKKYLSEIETVVKNNKLVIRNLDNHFFDNVKANVSITLPELKGLGVSGSGAAKVESKLKTDGLNLSVSGSGKIYVAEINADKLDCSISGSGDINLNDGGVIDKGSISISGSGNFSGESIRYDNLHVGISGSGNCRCNVSDNLEARISGSGNVYYKGNPKIDARVSGSGHVRSK